MSIPSSISGKNVLGRRAAAQALPTTNSAAEAITVRRKGSTRRRSCE